MFYLLKSDNLSVTAFTIFIFELFKLLLCPPSLELFAAVWIYLSKLALKLFNFLLKPSGFFSKSDLFEGMEVYALVL